MRLTSFFATMVTAALTLGGCAHLNSVSQTQIPARRSKVVEAETSKWIIFFLSFDNDYVDELSAKLKSTCPNGDVRGILTKDETYNYFIGLVMKRKVTAEGY